MFSDELMEAMLEGSPTVEQIREAVRLGTLSLKLTPVLVGSAYKNKAVQPLLDAVGYYLPNPVQSENVALNLLDNEAEVKLSVEPATTRWSRWPSSSRTAATGS